MRSDDMESGVPRWRRYLRFWRTDVAADVRDEISFHIEGLVAHLMRSGIPEAEARRIAAERFGNADAIGRQMRFLANQRESTMRRTEHLQHLLRDLRFARRQLAKRPAFTAVAIVTLALGIGANTAIFSAVNAVLLHPLAVRGIDQLAIVHLNLPKLPLMDTPLDPTETLELSEHPLVFQAVGASTGGSLILAGNDGARRLQSARTLGNFFDVFGIVPAAGRFYRADASTPGNERVVVLSYPLWQELGGQKSIIGQRLQFTTGSYEIVGVAPRGFRYPNANATDLWIPFAIAPAAACGNQEQTPDGYPCRIPHGRLMMATIGRLLPGTTKPVLQRRLDQLATTLHPTSPKEQLYYSSKTLVDETAAQLRPALLALLGAVGFVLLIACANVASLQLVHGTARARELAVRAALGAERGVIARQLLVENLVLSIAGGVVGLGLGAVILKLLALAGGAEMPALADVHLDRTVLAFTAVATITSGLLFGLIPAIKSSRVDLQTGLKEGGRGMSFGVDRHRLLHAGVILQVALSLILLLGSSLMVRTMKTLLEQNPGFRPDGVATMRVSFAGPRYSGRGARIPAYNGIMDRLSATPGITAAGLVSDLPFTGGTDSSPFQIEGMPADSTGPARHANLVTVGGDYFRAMGIRLVSGRFFDNSDVNGGTPVALIDEALAKTFFGSVDPIGKKIDQAGPTATIVGVVGTVSQIDLSDAPKATIYYPIVQHDWYSGPYVVVRSALPLGTVSKLVRSALASIDQNAPLFAQRMLVDRVKQSLAPRQLTMTVMSGLAAVSLLLAVCGLYGVISYAVSQRSTEFGIRMALGAQAGQVRGIVVKEGIVLATGGIVIGLIAAGVAAKFLGALLYGVSEHDPVSFAGAAILLAAVAAGASYLPAVRATHVNPVEALRRGS